MEAAQRDGCGGAMPRAAPGAAAGPSTPSPQAVGRRKSFCDGGSPGSSPHPGVERPPKGRRRRGGQVVVDDQYSGSLLARVRAEAAYNDDDDDCAPCSDEDEDGGWSSAGSSYGGRSRSTTFGRSPPHRCVNVVPHPLAHSQLSEEAELQLALALSLSASMGGAAGTPGRSRGEWDAHRLPPRPPRRRGGIDAGVDAELTYETLVQLEDVKLTASQACVDALPVLAFDPRDAHGDAGACCSICLELYSEGDSLLKLPCGHVMHNAPCGREYLLNWSKKCPECKRSATGE